MSEETPKVIKGIQWIREGDDNLVLYVHENGRKVRYNCSSIAVEDYRMKDISMSKGFATAQRALKLGYSYIDMEKMEEEEEGT